MMLNKLCLTNDNGESKMSQMKDIPLVLWIGENTVMLISQIFVKIYFFEWSSTWTIIHCHGLLTGLYEAN